MKFSREIVVGICVVAGCAAFAASQSASSGQEDANLQTPPMLETESGPQGSITEQESDWLEAHESNGPEGARGVPMQKMSLFQCGLVLAVLAISGSLATSAQTGNSTKP